MEESTGTSTKTSRASEPSCIKIDNPQKITLATTLSPHDPKTERPCSFDTERRQRLPQ